MNAHNEPESSTHPDDMGVSNTLDVSMKLENFMLEEFKHESAFIMQIMQDITSSLNLYFLLLGIFVSGLGLAYQSNLITKPFLQPILIVFLFIFGVIHFFFFVRFISFGFVYRETSERLDVIRKFYVQQFQSQIPTLGDILRSYTGSTSFYTVFLPLNSLLGFLLALISSLCFAGVTFLVNELLFHINNGVIFPLPSDIRPYIFGLIVGIAVFVFQTLYYRQIQEIAKKLNGHMRANSASQVSDKS